MTYSLWSRGRQLGESPLDFVRCLPGLRVGFLHPTSLGNALLPVAAGVTPASLAFGHMLRSLKRDCPEKVWLEMTEYADYISACDEEAALELELRGPDGKVIPTKDIAVRDTEFLIAWSEEAAKRDAERSEDSANPSTMVAANAARPWESEQDEIDVDDMIEEFEALAAEDAADACWRPPREERRWMRYQLQVQLASDWLIP